MVYCSNCGYELPPGSVFCGHCGQVVNHGMPSTSKTSSFVGGINNYIGNRNVVRLNWKDLFSAVPKKHTTQEAEDIFICGTSHTTPSLSEVSETWPKPWLYSRVFVCFLITYILLHICSIAFNNQNTYPGLIIVGAFAVPFTTMVLFMEVNAFRNISVYDVMKFFLIGGCASLVVTLFLYNLNIVDTDLSTTWGAIMVGSIEEVGKLVIVYFLVKQLTQCNYILSALLAGACVGAGFAAFESAGYALQPMLAIANMAGASGQPVSTELMMDSVTDSIYIRGLLAPGGHVAWAAITAGALIISKGATPLTTAVFTNSRFWKIFSIPIILHSLWDAPIFDGYIKLISLIVIVWIVVLILINMGLDEVKNLKGTI